VFKGLTQRETHVSSNVLTNVVILAPFSIKYFCYLLPFTIFTHRSFDDVKHARCNTKMLTVVASFLVNVKEIFPT